jgi:benzodiazapine receptor
MKKKKFLVENIPLLIFCIAICQGTGLLASAISSPEIPTWYATLAKPSFNPPNGIFGPVWTFLYTLMGIALYRVWIWGRHHHHIGQALAVFWVHLFLNFAWSVIFFGLQSPGVAFIEIIALWISILAVMWQFYKVDRIASLLLNPYLAWVTFAAILNFCIYRLN